MNVQVHGLAEAGPPRDESRPVPQAIATLAITAKVVVLLLVVGVLVDPVGAHLDGKAPVARVVMYPLWLMVVPVVWSTTRRSAAFPWLADLLVTLTCLLDLTGNRLDLYNSVNSFDDWIHVINAGLVSAAFVVLTVKPTAMFAEIVEAAIAFGLTASLGWELFEYATFLTRSTEWTSAYADTIGDLSLGFLGSLLAGLVLVSRWHHRDPPGLGSGRPLRP